MESSRNNLFTLFAASMGGAFLFAITYVVVFTLFLPSNALAFGLAAVEDPLFFALRDRNLRHCLPIVYGTVLLEIAIVTPFSASLGFLGSFVALIVSVAACLFIFKTPDALRMCSACGYDLKAHSSSHGRCPECGGSIRRTRASPTGI